MLDEEAIVSVTGKRIPCAIGSICVHGDGPDAVATARYLNERLTADGLTFVPLYSLQSGI